MSEPIDLIQALRDEAQMMSGGLFGRTPYPRGPHVAMADMLERIAERLEGVDVTAKFEDFWRPKFEAEDAERKAARDERDKKPGFGWLFR